MVRLRSMTELARLFDDLPPLDQRAADQARRRQNSLTKPPGSLGRLEELAVWVSAVQGRHPPRLERVEAHVFAGNHGVAARGVSAYPAEVTRQMVANFERGGAAINQIARAAGAELRVTPLHLERPTRDFTTAAAMDVGDFLEAFRSGFEAVDGQPDLVAVGEMGIANTTTAAALTAALLDLPAERCVGPGTGVDAEGRRRKLETVRAGIARHRAEAAGSPLEWLRRLGGFEMAAMSGLVLGARHRRVPVLLDGYVATAAALVVHAMDAAAIRHCEAGHLSAEPAHRLQLERLGLRPLLDLGLRLGEGSGAALAISLVRTAIACHCGMATFEDAGVSRESKSQTMGEARQ